jgi:hypothetical protein
VTVRRDSFLGRVAVAAQNPPALFRVRVSPTWARFLIAAGARPVTAGRDSASRAIAVSSSPASEALREQANADSIARFFTIVFGRLDRAQAFRQDARLEVALALTMSRSLGCDIARMHNSQIGRTLASALDSAFDTLGGVSALDSVRPRLNRALGDVHALESALNRAVALYRAFERTGPVYRSVYRFVDIDLCLDFNSAWLGRARQLITTLTADITEAIILARLENLDRSRMIRSLDAAARLSAEIGRGLLIDLRDADLRGADLAAADLGQADLRGVLWSRSTKWPTWARKDIQASSTEVEEGVFRVETAAWAGRLRGRDGVDRAGVRIIAP